MVLHTETHKKEKKTVIQQEISMKKITIGSLRQESKRKYSRASSANKKIDIVTQEA